MLTKNILLIIIHLGFEGTNHMTRGSASRGVCLQGGLHLGGLHPGGGQSTVGYGRYGGRYAFYWNAFLSFITCVNVDLYVFIAHPLHEGSIISHQHV